MKPALTISFAAALQMVLCSWSAGQDDVADVPSKEMHIGANKLQRYFLIGPVAEAPLERGFGLILVLPGGDGSADFHPFVKRVYKNAVPKGYFVAQLIAIPSAVWPTEKYIEETSGNSTEAFVDAVIEDVRRQHRLNAERIFTLSWSSGGPAAYAVSLANPKVRGSLIAMSVFKPQELPSLEAAKGHAYYLYHSRDDRICPFRMAEEAVKALGDQGAKVKLVEYAGGHGWRGDVFGDIRRGIEWLEENAQR
jgi:predicted esterase